MSENKDSVRATSGIAYNVYLALKSFQDLDLSIRLSSLENDAKSNAMEELERIRQSLLALFILMNQNLEGP